MGLGSLLSALFGGSQQTPQMVQPQGSDPVPASPQHTYGMDSGGYVVPTGPAGQQGIQMVHNDDPVMVPPAVRPDPWKPRHQTVLGALGDAYLEAHGMKPGFQIERDKRSMEEAMQGFDQNPMKAIRRVEQMEPDTAWKMYNTQVDNQRQQGQLDRQNRYMDLANENIVYGRVANAMRTATPDTWGPMRDQMIKLAKSRGVDMEDIIPKDYDKTAADTIMYGAYPVARQVSHDDRVRGQNIAIERNKVLAGQGNARIGIAKTNSETGQYNAKTARMNATAKPDKGQGSTGVVNTSAGQRPYEIAPDGNSMVVHDGETPHRYIKAGVKNGKINWVPTNEAPSK